MACPPADDKKCAKSAPVKMREERGFCLCEFSATLCRPAREICDISPPTCDAVHQICDRRLGTNLRPIDRKSATFAPCSAILFKFFFLRLKREICFFCYRLRSQSLAIYRYHAAGTHHLLMALFLLLNCSTARYGHHHRKSGSWNRDGLDALNNVFPARYLERGHVKRSCR